MDTQNQFEGIAIIGLAGRFPGARNIDEFWNNLVTGKENISFFSDDELLASGIDPDLIKDPNYIKARGILGDTDLFDATFFNFSPKVAELMDPQHRFFLECAWEALEHAGYDPDRYPGRIGVYAGSSMNTYLLINLYSHLDLVASAQGLQAAIGNDKDSLTTEVSYHFNLKGPGVTVQTSSSTSLSSVHIACQSVLNYECDMALAGGVSIHFPERSGYLYTEGGTTSRDGHCRAYDSQAEGFVSGHGCGVVVLKRLADAVEDGDTIYAVIKGSAMNNDGSAKVSYMAPSVEGHAEVVALAQAIAGVSPDMISYVEGHGTGTPMGDPIEVAGLTQAFRARTDRKNFCVLGSVKTNIGHLDSASGVAGLIKTTLALKHKQIPPTLHFKQPNPQIDFENSPFYINTQLMDWKANGLPRRAGVSSLGMGGTNAHAVLEEAPLTEASSPSRPWQLLLLSARSQTALEASTDNLADYLEKHPDINLADAAYTLKVGRRDFNWRRAIICQQNGEAITALETRAPERVWTDTCEAYQRSIAFMFTGQGAQYPNMGLELYQTETVFREHVDHCCTLLKPHLGLDLRTLLYPPADQIESAAQALNQTAITQPALFVIEYALAQLWMAWGLQPQAMIGHSIGEYVAACLAGVFTLEDGLALVATRGRLMQQLPAGSMLSVSLPAANVLPLLNGQLSLAASNGPSACVVSGPAEAIAEFEQQLNTQDIPNRRLHTSHAFHSTMMEPLAEPFTDLVKSVRLNAPAIPYISNVTGTWITAAEATDPSYWFQHLRQAVRFAEGIEILLQEPGRVLLEVGPGQTLSTLARQHTQRQPAQAVLPSLRHPQERQGDSAFLFATLGKLWLAGVVFDWRSFYAAEHRQRIALPTYPFERQRYWVEPGQPASRATREIATGKKPDLSDWFYLPAWKRTVLPTPQTELQPSKSWLLFEDDTGIGASLSKALRAAGHNIIQVTPGEQFEALQPNHYCLRPGLAEDYQALLNALDTSGITASKIVHLWSLTSDVRQLSFEETQNRGFHSLLFLAQALGEHTNWPKIQIDVVSTCLHSLNENETAHPFQATLLGAVKVIPQEYTHLACRSIDIVMPQAGSWQSTRVIQLLQAELELAAPDLAVAYRGNERWVQTFEPIRLEKNELAPSRLRQGGVYLITGGMGELGLIVAGYLARTVQAKLALVGRSTLPDRADWDQWLEAHPTTDAISQKIRRVRAMESDGAEVLVFSADVAQPAAMQTVLAQTLERFGQLNGVIHAAGLTGEDFFRPFSETSLAECEQHFRAKVEGTLVLEQLLQGQALDFCLLFSSLASVLGGLGLGTYAAANLAMDGLARQHNQNDPVSWTSINWDAWQFDTDRTQNRGATLAEFAITATEGEDILQRILSHPPLTQVVVTASDLSERMSQWLHRENASEQEAQTAPPANLHPRPNLQNAYVAPSTETEQAVAEVWQAILGIEQVGVYDNFFELGGSSLTGIQVIGKLKEKFNVPIPAVSLYEGPTVSALAKLIHPDQEETATAGESRQRGERRRARQARKHGID